MGPVTGLLAWMQRRLTSKMAKDCWRMTEPYLKFVVEHGGPRIKKEVPTWNLENVTLQRYLGYVAGVIDACLQNQLGASGTKVHEAVQNRVFHLFIERYLSDVAGVEVFFSINKTMGNLSRSPVGGLQHYDDFLKAEILGGTDWSNLGSRGFFPVGLMDLGFMLPVD